jgi:hypothetical protein
MYVFAQIGILSLSFQIGLNARAQEKPSSVLEDFKPASTNQMGSEYPQVNSEGRVRARIKAPEANSVFLNIDGIRYPLTKDSLGFWMGDSEPLDEGNHYYGLVIDGAEVPDPGSTFILLHGLNSAAGQWPYWVRADYVIDMFNYIGGFSSAPNTNQFGGLSNSPLLPDPDAAKEKLKVLWLGCGSKDVLIRVSQGVHQYLKEQEIPHVWHVDGNAHDDTEWANNLYLFVQHIFEE